MIEFSLSEKLYTMIFRAARILRRGSELDTELPPGQLRLLALIWTYLHSSACWNLCRYALHH